MLQPMNQSLYSNNKPINQILYIHTQSVNQILYLNNQLVNQMLYLNNKLVNQIWYSNNHLVNQLNQWTRICILIINQLTKLLCSNDQLMDWTQAIYSRDLRSRRRMLAGTPSRDTDSTLRTSAPNDYSERLLESKNPKQLLPSDPQKLFNILSTCKNAAHSQKI
jgi:hypothetical protein